MWSKPLECPPKHTKFTLCIALRGLFVFCVCAKVVILFISIKRNHRKGRERNAERERDHEWLTLYAFLIDSLQLWWQRRRRQQQQHKINWNRSHNLIHGMRCQRHHKVMQNWQFFYLSICCCNMLLNRILEPWKMFGHAESKQRNENHTQEGKSKRTMRKSQ